MSQASTLLDDDEHIVASTPQYAIVTRTAKRNRADSSPLAERSRIVIQRKDTPLNPTATREDTPAASEVGTPSEVASDLGSTATGTLRRNKTKLRRLNGNPESELAACIVHIRESKSEAYRDFEDPVIKVNEEGPPTHYEFVCKQIGTAETSSLLGHLRKCAAVLKQQEVLNVFSMTGGNSYKMTAEETREFVALWVAENARPFNAINDCYLKKLLHPDACKYLPHRHTITQDIKRMYEAT
ncbi:hypothetical protein FRC06_002412, partial [Ceratobasidium sp. 370]